MIKITRPAEIPQILVEQGSSKTEELKNLYDNGRQHYDSGVCSLNFDSKIYGHSSVKVVLETAQRRKCCYCESKFRAMSFGAVEHFRPKGAVRQNSGDARLHPGYFWLAYEWTNLLVSCERCNTSHKKDLFPLEEPQNRARNHHEDLDAEAPLFIDPSREDPKDHLKFRGDGVEALTRRAAVSIEGFGLRRHDLVEARRARLEILRFLVTILKLGNSIPEERILEARLTLERYKSECEDYSAMARDFLAEKLTLSNEPAGDSQPVTVRA